MEKPINMLNKIFKMSFLFPRGYEIDGTSIKYKCSDLFIEKIERKGEL